MCSNPDVIVQLGTFDPSGSSSFCNCRSIRSGFAHLLVWVALGEVPAESFLPHWHLSIMLTVDRSRRIIDWGIYAWAATTLHGNIEIGQQGELPVILLWWEVEGVWQQSPC